MKNIIIILLFSLSASVFAIPQFAGPYDMGLIESNEITEASGLVASRQNGEVFWLHNDSGSENVIYAINRQGENLGRFILPGINMRDVEDIALGTDPVDGEDYLYLADTGDNGGSYSEKYIYRFLEPVVQSNQAPAEVSINSIETITFQYSDGVMYDSETLLHDPNSGDLYLVTKRAAAVQLDHVFLLSYPQSTGGLITAEEVTTLDYPDFNGYGATGGDVSASGLEMVLKTYSNIYYFAINPDEDFTQIFNSDYMSVTYTQEVQGEALAWQANGDGYYTVSEETLDIPAHLSFYPRVNNFITIPQLPTSLYLQNELFNISWQPENLECKLFASDEPGSEIIVNYQDTGLTGIGSISSRPSSLGWNTGIYYCVLYNEEYGYISTEFTIFVESSQAVNMISPENGSELYDPTPVFSWEATPGVPYYFLTLTDQPFTISEDENGNPVVEGMQPIWQIITSETSMLYATSDPSGFFPNNAPPLIPDQEYSWIVANNYGNDPLLSSKVVSTPVSFTFRSDVSFPEAQLIFPADEANIGGVEINFVWSIVEDASLYYFTLYETTEENGSTGQYLIWQQTTSSNQVIIPASSMLFNNHYVWNVIASNGIDANSQSDTYGFYYDTAIGTIDLYVKNSEGAPVSYATVELIPENGAYNIVPFGVNSGGHEVKIVAPGSYNLISSKTNYDTVEMMVDIAIDTDPSSSSGDTVVNVVMDLASSYINGAVKDTAGQLIEFVNIIATSSEGDIRELNSPTGIFHLGISGGNWEISAEKAGYTLVESILINILPGETLNIPNLILTANTTAVSGITRSSLGNPLASVQVLAEYGNYSFTATSNSSGSFSLPALPHGEWLISGSKAGFTSPQPQLISLDSFSPSQIVLPDFILTNNAGIIAGTAGNGVVPLQGVLVIATPEAGSPSYKLTNAYGAFSFSLLPGNYTITASRPGYFSADNLQFSLSSRETINNLYITLMRVNCAISGVVTANGEPLALATVSAGPFSTVSGENGQFLLPVAQGSYLVSVVKNGYSASGPQQVTVSGGQTAEGLNFQLSLNPSVISGKVLSLNQIIAEATVTGIRLPNNNPITPAVTDGEGNYQLNLIPALYKIWPEKSGFITAQADTLLINVQPATNYFNQNLELTTYRSFISGSCTSLDGSPLENVLISVSGTSNLTYNYSTITNSLGNYSITVSPEDSYLVTASKTGYSSGYETTTVLYQDQVATLNFSLEQLPITVNGIVTDQDAAPLASVTITAYSQDDIYTTESLSDGSFQLSLSSGSYLLQAAKLGYTQALQGLNVAIGQPVENINFILEENYGILEGTVRNINSEPLEGVHILANLESRNTAVSDENGEYIITDLLPGIYPEVIFTKSGYETIIVRNTVIPPQVAVNLQVEMVPLNSSLTVTILDESNNPLANATVLIENTLNGDTYSNLTNMQGVSLTEALPSLVPLQIVIQKPGYYAEPVSVTLDPNSNEEIEISMQLISGAIFGTVGDISEVLARDLRGLGGVVINAISSEGFSGSALSLADGTYRIENLHPLATYEISAILAGYSLLENPQVFLNEGEQQLDLNMYPHNITVTGSVLDQHNNPLAEVLISALSNNVSINAISNSNGYFSLNGLAPNHEYLISSEINAPGYNDVYVLITTTTINSDIGNIVVTINKAILRGVVRDSNTLNPLSNVYLAISGIQSTYTNEDGSYILRFLPEGSYQLQVRKDSYQNENIIIQLGFIEDQTLDLEMLYSEPVSISGLVQDSSGRNISEAPVNIYYSGLNFSTFSNEEGEYIFDEVAPYKDISLGTGFPTELYDNVSVNLSTTNLDVISDLTIDIHAAMIAGTITADSGGAVAGAEVILSNNSVDDILISADDGSFSFPYLYEGDYALHISAPGFNLFEQNISISDFQELELNPQLTSTIGNISGRVKQLDSINLENAIVELWQQEVLIQSDTTSVSGIFSFANLPQTQEFQIQVFKAGYQNFDIDSVTPGDSPLIIPLTPYSNSVLGTVRYNLLPVASAEVIAKNSVGEEFETFTNQFGDYVISGLNGYYQIQAVSNDLVSLAVLVNIEGAGVRADLELGLSAHITGRILYQGSGKPGVLVSAANTLTGNVYQDTSDELGNYDVNGLPAGIYQISMFLAGFTVNEDLPTVTAANGEAVYIPDVTLSFQQNSIAGTVQQNNRDEIENALVTLWQDGAIIDSTYSDGNGNFLYEELVDGLYQLQASHPAYLNSDFIQLELMGGNSTPPLAEFILEPLEFVIFGMIRDQENFSLSSVEVTATSGEESFSSFSDFSGQYSLQLPEPAEYTIYAHKDGYEDSDILNITVSEENNLIQQNFILNEIIQTTTLSGKVIIYNLDSNLRYPPENTLLTLSQDDNIISTIQLSSPDSTYIFEELIVPRSYSLEVTATFEGQEFYRFVPDIQATTNEPLTENITFAYQENSISLSGNIMMNDGVILPVSAVHIQLSAPGFFDETYTNQTGYYQFDNLEEQSYSLHISAEYDNEIFEEDYEVIWTGEDLIQNHTFFYHLAGLDFSLIQAQNLPIINASIKINGPGTNLQLNTNSSGYASTGLILPTQSYGIKIYREQGNFGTFINPTSFNLQLDSLETYSKNILLPLQFNDSQLEPLAAIESKLIRLNKSPEYSENVYLYYSKGTSTPNSILMNEENENTLIAEIPAQNSSGLLSLWFNSYDASQLLNFSNADDPFNLQLTNAGLPSIITSSLTPRNPVLAYNQQLMLQLNIKDDLGNNLNDLVDSNGEVDWYLSNEELGTITLLEETNLQAIFDATGAVNGDLLGNIRCRINLNNVTINLTSAIEIKDMQLALIQINGPSEVAAGSNVTFNVTALSDKNIVMNIPLNWSEIPLLYGSAQTEGNQLVFSASTQFIGDLQLNVSAIDPTYGHVVAGKKLITVYQQITGETNSSVVNTGLGCELLISDDILNGDRVETAKLYLKQQISSPNEVVGISNETISNIFRISSNRVDADFNELPGLRFSLPNKIDEEKISLGYWSEDSVDWQTSGAAVYWEAEQKIELNPLPVLSASYGVLAESDKLGIQDLRLSPNPFTPNDIVGFNKGMQIEFKLSSKVTRSPLISVKIYTLNGKLVRTIAHKKAMLKGSYKAGEITTLYWNGKTDDNRMARNGRYVVKVIAEDNKHREELLKTVVLVK